MRDHLSRISLRYGTIKDMLKSDFGLTERTAKAVLKEATSSKMKILLTDDETTRISKTKCLRFNQDFGDNNELPL